MWCHFTSFTKILTNYLRSVNLFLMGMETGPVKLRRAAHVLSAFEKRPLHFPRPGSPNESPPLAAAAAVVVVYVLVLVVLPGSLEILEELRQQRITAHSLRVADDSQLLLGSSYRDI